MEIVKKEKKKRPYYQWYFLSMTLQVSGGNTTMMA